MSGGPILADEVAWVAVCAADRLSEQTMICGRAAGVALLVIRDGDRLFACERACPHEQADLSLGRVDDGKLYCPRHLAWFSLQDGGISPGWSSRALRRYPARIANGEVQVDLGADAG
ncbi:Rieske 2Fe-2S domain-containing protein [Tardiphaga sp.]|uniref:Rieske (2Fe-2S) protein n=1 Tax=Tardiphaga sp. TaxID=1926292 RepID=UPI002637DF62|nr:Rieske 2Fe-2S domain-containing protein [Tardiphaga sp.]MDB5618142.1 ferredoxin [Tardiphaga sp.]